MDNLRDNDFMKLLSRHSTPQNVIRDCKLVLVKKLSLQNVIDRMTALSDGDRRKYEWKKTIKTTKQPLNRWFLTCVVQEGIELSQQLMMAIYNTQDEVADHSELVEVLKEKLSDLSTPSTTDLSTRSTAEPSTPSTTDSSTRSTAEPSTQSTTEPSTQSTTEPSTQSTTEPSTQSTTDPSMQSTTESSTRSTTESSTRSTTELSTRSTTEPSTPSTTEPSTRSTTEPSTQSTTEPSKQSTTESSTRSTTEPSTQSTTEPSTQSTTELSTRSTTERSTQSTTEPSTPSTTEPSTRSTTEPSTPSTTEPSTPSTTEPSTQSTTLTSMQSTWSRLLVHPIIPSCSTNELPIIRGSVLDKAIETVKRATAADQRGDYLEAVRLYEHTVEYFLHAIKYETHGYKSQATLRLKCGQYLDRAQELKKKHLFKKINSVEESKKKHLFKKSNSDSNKRPWVSGERNSFEDEDKMKEQLSSAIVSDKPNVSWDDIVGLESIKQSLKESIIFPLRFPHLFTGKRTACRGILLYGPPGTGKSYLAKAVASEANSTFFSISSPHLVSKYLGESERLVRKLFEMARTNKPATIFIDQVEIMCGRGDASKRIQAEFRAQLNGANNGVMVLGATDLPWLLDHAIRNQFEMQVYIPLPEANARHDMFKKLLQSTPHEISDTDFLNLARQTDGYSGADIGIATRDALMQPLRRVQGATHFRQLSGNSPINHEWKDDLLTPCAPSAPGAMEMSWLDVRPDQLLEPKLTMSDFVRSLSKTKPTVSHDDLKNFEDFTKAWGQKQ